MLIDVHAHLCDEKLKPLIDEIISDSEKGLPNRIIDTGSNFSTSLSSFENALKFDNVFCAVGIHPEDANNVKPEYYDAFSDMWKKPKTVAIGEIGLDYHYENNPHRDVQKRVFCEQLELAYTIKAPSVVHIRDAYGDAFKLLSENSKLLYYGILIHCYGGSKEMIECFNKFDAYYSYGGVTTFKNARERVEAVKATPVDRILSETDCPYMSPEPYRGKTNLPRNVELVVKRISNIIEKDQNETEEILAKNAFRLFKKLK